MQLQSTGLIRWSICKEKEEDSGSGFLPIKIKFSFVKHKYESSTD